MTSKRSLRSRTIPTSSTTTTSLTEAALLVLQILDYSRISLQEQRDRNLLKFEKNDDEELLSMINDLINKYPDIKTSLTLTELWLPSNRSRAKQIPRAQNNFLLFRRDISRGLCNANNSLTVSDASKVIAKLYKELSEREKEFWIQLGTIVREKHKKLHPNYKYTPMRNKKRRSQTLSTISAASDISSFVSGETSTTTANKRHVRQETNRQSQIFENSDTSPSVNERSEGTKIPSTIMTNERRSQTSVKPSFRSNIVVVPTSQYQPAIITQQNATAYSVPQYSSQFINSSDLTSQQQLLNLYLPTGPTHYYREIIPPVPITQRIYSQTSPPQFVTSALIMTTPQQNAASRSPLPPTAGTEFYCPLREDLILLSQSLGLDDSNGIDPNLLNSDY